MSLHRQSSRTIGKVQSTFDVIRIVQCQERDISCSERVSSGGGIYSLTLDDRDSAFLLFAVAEVYPLLAHCHDHILHTPTLEIVCYLGKLAFDLARGDPRECSSFTLIDMEVVETFEDFIRKLARGRCIEKNGLTQAFRFADTCYYLQICLAQISQPKYMQGLTVSSGISSWNMTKPPGPESRETSFALTFPLAPGEIRILFSPL